MSMLELNVMRAQEMASIFGIWGLFCDDFEQIRVKIFLHSSVQDTLNPVDNDG